jgi:hypothetical protein
MPPIHFEALERVEFDACADLYRAAPESVRVAHAIAVQTIGRVTCLTSRGIEPAAMFRRAVAVGVGHATSEAELDAALACMHGIGLRHAVPLAPQSQPLRIREAAARGARIAVTETGERLPDRPSASYRNILRAGFEEMYLRQNYMSAAA